MTIEDRLARLESEGRLARDKQQIHDLIMTYCRGVDRADVDVLSTVFSDLQGSGGVAIDAKRIIDNVVKTSKMTMHFVGNVLIDVKGDEAKSESYFISYQLVDRDGKDFMRERSGRYLHRWARTGDRWLMTNVAAVDEWNRIAEVKERAPGADQWRYGVRSREDPVFKL